MSSCHVLLPRPRVSAGGSKSQRKKKGREETRESALRTHTQRVPALAHSSCIAVPECGQRRLERSESCAVCATPGARWRLRCLSGSQARAMSRSARRGMEAGWV